MIVSWWFPFDICTTTTGGIFRLVVLTHQTSFACPGQKSNIFVIPMLSNVVLKTNKQI